jgi:hypothetical protein
LDTLEGAEPHLPKKRSRKTFSGKPFQEASPPEKPSGKNIHGVREGQSPSPEKLLWKKVNKILKQDCVFGVCADEVTGVREGVSPSWHTPW